MPRTKKVPSKASTAPSNASAEKALEVMRNARRKVQVPPQSDSDFELDSDDERKLKADAKKKVTKKRKPGRPRKASGSKGKGPMSASPVDDSEGKADLRYIMETGEVYLSKIKKGDLDALVAPDKHDLVSIQDKVLGLGSFGMLNGPDDEEEVDDEEDEGCPDQTNRKMLPVEAVKLLLNAGEVTHITAINEDGKQHIIFASLPLQVLHGVPFGPEVHVFSNYGYCVEMKELGFGTFDVLVRNAVNSEEFHGAGRQECSEYFRDYLLRTYKGRPHPKKPSTYTCAIPLWSNVNLNGTQGLVARTITKVGQTDGVMFGDVLEILYHEVKVTMKEYLNITRDDALRAHTRMTFWHLVTFVCGYCNHSGTSDAYETAFFTLLGVLCRDMAEDGHIRGCFARNDDNTFLIPDGALAVKDTLNMPYTDKCLWGAMGGLLESILFQETDKLCIENVQFDVELFTSDPSLFFHTVIEQICALRNGASCEPISYAREVYHPNLFV